MTTMGVKLKAADCSIWARRKASTTPMRLTSAVSLVSPMKSLRSGGMIRRTAWGTTTKRSAFHWREAQRACRGLLARVDRLDAGAVDLGDVRGVDEHEGHEAPEELVAGDAEGRQAQAEHVDDEDAGQAAEDVDVDDGEAPDRREDGTLQAAQDGQDEPEDEHEDLGQQEEHDVPPEGGDDLGGRSGRHLGVEEGLLDARPGRQVDDDVADDAQHEQRADDGHDDSPASLLGIAEES